MLKSRLTALVRRLPELRDKLQGCHSENMKNLKVGGPGADRPLAGHRGSAPLGGAGGQRPPEAEEKFEIKSDLEGSPAIWMYILHRKKNVQKSTLCCSCPFLEATPIAIYSSLLSPPPPVSQRLLYGWKCTALLNFFASPVHCCFVLIGRKQQ